MDTCCVVLAAVAVLAALVAAWAYLGLRRAAAALRGWGLARSPGCVRDTTPPACRAVLADPGPPPDGLAGPAQAFAARAVARLAAYAGGGDGALLQLEGRTPAVCPDGARQPLAAVWAGGDTAVVAVRGTQTVADLQADLRVSQTAPLAPPSRGAFAELGGASALRVHSGMYGLYAGIRPALFAALLPSTRAVLVTGHSMGAAVAFFFALDAAASGLATRAIGFAPPRAGNGAFAEAVSSAAETLSIINLADLVPSLPWSYMPAVDQPTAPYAFAHVQPVAIFNAASTDIASCHAIPTYFSAVAAGAAVGVRDLDRGAQRHHDERG